MEVSCFIGKKWKVLKRVYRKTPSFAALTIGIQDWKKEDSLTLFFQNQEDMERFIFSMLNTETRTEE